MKKGEVLDLETLRILSLAIKKSKSFVSYWVIEKEKFSHLAAFCVRSAVN